MVLAFLLLVSSAQALETDNYYAWGHELQESREAINLFFNRIIAEELEAADRTSCDDLTKRIGRRLRSHWVHDNPVENWVFPRLSSEQAWPDTYDYVARSIYRDPYLPYIPQFGLAPTVRVAGFYFGMDKLSHFASTGQDYFRIYRAKILRGATEAEATEAAIGFGILDENGLHGYAASGVYSFADLEANYRGLLFFRRLCFDEHGTYLSRGSGGEWRQRTPFDIGAYVDGSWDESFNLSYRLPANWKKVAPVLKHDYCPVASARSVRMRFRHYQARLKPSASRAYLRGRQERGDRLVPNPEKDQSFSALCAL